MLATFQELAARAQEKGILDGGDAGSLREWRADTTGWSKRHES